MGNIPTREGEEEEHQGSRRSSRRGSRVNDAGLAAGNNATQPSRWSRALAGLLGADTDTNAREMLDRRSVRRHASMHATTATQHRDAARRRHRLLQQQQPPIAASISPPDSPPFTMGLPKSVDGGGLEPKGVFPGSAAAIENVPAVPYRKNRVMRLMLERDIAPFYQGKEDASSDSSHQSSLSEQIIQQRPVLSVSNTVTAGNDTPDDQVHAEGADVGALSSSAPTSALSSSAPTQSPWLQSENNDTAGLSARASSVEGLSERGWAGKDISCLPTEELDKFLSEKLVECPICFLVGLCYRFFHHSFPDSVLLLVLSSQY